MSDAKIASIPDFVLPQIYGDRNAHPLPGVVNHESDAASKPYMPPTNWSIDGWSCANASAVSFTYDYAVQSLLGITTASSGSVPLYTYNYTYHFLDNGDQATGGDGWMYVEAFDILKATGCPTSTDFGGFDGGIDQTNAWMSGYDKYYKAMKVRLDQYYKIDPNAAGADEMIKQIVYDFADGSPAGSFLTFQANAEAMPTTTINGRKTFTSLGGGGGHALTICGYDDSFQGGSWLVQSGWGDGDYWCPYTLLHGKSAWYDNPLNNAFVMFCRVKINYSPKVTFKIGLTHNQRNKICLMTGVANAPNAASPTTTMDYAGAFNFSGGSLPLCGSGKSSTIEIGLDLTDLLSTVTVSQPTFFLKIISKGGTGQVNSLALENYGGGAAQEATSTQTNVPIVTGTTLMAITMPPTRIAADDPKANHSSRESSLVASYDSRLKTVRFRVPGNPGRAVQLHIADLRGNSIATITGNAACASWDLRRRSIVGRGAYIATVNDGPARTYTTKFYIE